MVALMLVLKVVNFLRVKSSKNIKISYFMKLFLTIFNICLTFRSLSDIQAPECSKNWYPTHYYHELKTTLGETEHAYCYSVIIVTKF